MTAAALLARIDALHAEATQMERPFAALVARDLAGDGALRALRVAVEALDTSGCYCVPEMGRQCGSCAALAEIARLLEVTP